MVLVTADVSSYFVQSRHASCIAYSETLFTVCLFVFLGVCDFQFARVSLHERVQSAETDFFIYFFRPNTALQQVSIN